MFWHEKLQVETENLLFSKKYSSIIMINARPYKNNKEYCKKCKTNMEIHSVWIEINRNELMFYFPLFLVYLFFDCSLKELQ